MTEPIVGTQMNSSYRIRRPQDLRRGLTTIELTVALAAVLLLLGMTYLGVRAYKKGSDRTGCVLNIYRTQSAVRAYANLRGLGAGQEVRRGDLRRQLMGPAGFLGSEPACPGGGTYATLGNRIPPRGELYLSCSLAEPEGHRPDDALP